MTVKLRVLAENSRVANGVEYVTATGMEESDKPLLQMIDYGLRLEEMSHKGKLTGKTLELQVENVRAIFAGRPQFSGKILKVA